MNKIFFYFFCTIFGIFSSGSFSLYAQIKTNYSYGVATGFPPYQYVDKDGVSSGLDVEVAELVFKTAGLSASALPNDWEELLFNLIHKKKMIDILCGTEITTERQKHLDFTVPYYERRTVLFTLKKTPIKKIEDLYGKIVTGDLHSSFEKILGTHRNSIRIMKTTTKEESFKKLKEGSVVAVIAPLEVGLYLSKQLGVELKIFDEGDPGSPVGIAVKKGDHELLDVLNVALKKLIKNGQIKKILKKYGQIERQSKKTKISGKPISLLACQSCY